ncbi:hypothetical protein CEXT_212791 [Caerostris extrusa]|uniref:DUS-like FMN-binding domain-containing protein n=1 Tax=Caerostris extrusa TaxID=172846 RepID=A0AAV4TC16_CAEEX|nr:hypothetical protein CEXT_212791 [Caerostris extrusa]
MVLMCQITTSIGDLQRLLEAGANAVMTGCSVLLCTSKCLAVMHQARFPLPSLADQMTTASGTISRL